MTSNLSKIVLLTGGSRGLGKDSALQLAKKGFDIILTYQSKKEAADEVVSEIEKLGQKAFALKLDISTTDGFDAFVDEVKNTLEKNFSSAKLDALVNNAGIGLHASFEETTEDILDAMTNIHFKGPFFLTQKLLPLLNDGSSVVNTSSGLARFSFPGYSAYGAMKAAIDALSRYQAIELGNRKIRVNSVAPGAIETDFGGGVVRDNADFNSLIASQTALGRVGLPDDIGSVVAFLCSDDSKWINAQRIEVSGGFRA
ncbi:NAD(P)-dependent dehydrogenase, short-chain alcohol dehydrogenase family [Chishuiella changwenlii]|uniref:NAD(P)-dependent dehydrogenase, short-chain alcohol dehydrogenase family n=1 Tax=Chishuiella changwenlii TaxID=1434701 RepID=A0A1M6UYG6_9FLAO|nr:SDR family oxidoreductase [Chishuiella changwenlii]GGF02341.1 short-chain dehydrogenase [Chishuiella changwenlii]SHK74258.1 NAD(P)-dependent dehydrogenase, short-chain alcohol dehydrogenase family [Chishuiella changwenlii]